MRVGIDAPFPHRLRGRRIKHGGGRSLGLCVLGRALMHLAQTREQPITQIGQRVEILFVALRQFKAERGFPVFGAVEGESWYGMAGPVTQKSGQRGSYPSLARG
jgi:hypothetical protein